MLKNVAIFFGIVLFIFFAAQELLSFEEFSDVSGSVIDYADSVKSLEANVSKVVDGDTIKVGVFDEQITIRLIGVDTPESVHPQKEVECFALEASQFVKDNLLGKTVTLIPDPTQGDEDKYGRKLRYVYLEDGSNFNEAIIKNGYGHEYTYNIPYQYQSEFIAAEKYAHENFLGLWAEGVCVN
ncbi:nuclease [Candidatus Peregrinibacteria bacterium]|nr:nuclease [Candidatus Peregrinibacteria bacterium]